MTTRVRASEARPDADGSCVSSRVTYLTTETLCRGQHEIVSKSARDDALLSMRGRAVLLLLCLFFSCSRAAFAPALLQPESYDAKSRDITVASVANQSATPRANDPAVTMEEKHLSEAASAQADRAVEELELLRDETWRNARGSLAIASDPPIRSGAVFEMLSAETERFAQLEASIKAAKAKQAHARRVAELTGSAWDAHEAFKLKELREQQAEFRAEEAKVARTEAAALEREYLKELRLEKARKL